MSAARPCPAPRSASPYRHNTGATDGSIIAIIMTIHMPTNDAATAGHVCPHMGIHIIDKVQPPGIGISPIVDIDKQAAMVAAALSANSNAQTP
ncbi:hypothetical protein [Paraburkholderia dilworthii]|uniref:hypothetical protein n=1 Tax=Paraburkholderia dilworthii TaxID=948106 RepID=UPI002ADE189A|nr:hypothetical protein [Paraburkholderia dilworthii]